MHHDRVSIIPAEASHIRLLMGRLRDADLCEIQAAGFDVRRALWRSYRASVFTRAAFVDGELAAGWGMGGSPFGKTGRPWLFTAPAAERVPVSFIKIGRAEVEKMLGLCPRLVGVVDAQYTRAVRFLAMMGFELSDPFQYGPREAPFRRYTIGSQ